VLEQRVAVRRGKVFGQSDAVAGPAQKFCQHLAPLILWAGAQVAAVKLQQIESVQEGSPRALTAESGAEQVEVGHTIRIANHALAVLSTRSL
jgi:hypothetical protein